MTSEVAVSLRPALAEDRFRIRRWLADPEIEAWWGNAASAEAEINLAMSSAAALCRIVESERCAGRLRACRGDRAVGRGRARRSWRPAPGTSTLFIASEAASRPRSRIAPRWPCSSRRCSPPRWPWRAAGVVSIRNEAAARAYERAGFRWQRIWSDRLLGPSWLMLKERPTSRRPGRRAGRPRPAGATPSACPRRRSPPAWP